MHLKDCCLGGQLTVRPFPHWPSSQDPYFVSPRPAPNPSVFAPNDPFNEGMTKGEAKVMPKVPGPVVPDEFAPVAPVGEMPAEPVPTPEENDPFK